MGINVSQFSPPGTVSKLVWDDDMKAGAGKIFKGDLTGNVTGNVTGDVTGDMVGNITNGGVNGYLLRSGVVSASSGTLIVPAGSSTGNTPVTINLNGNGTYCIVDNTQKCYYPSPCTIPVSLGIAPGRSSNGDAYARSYDADGVLIDSVGDGGNLNIYGATYIILNGGTETDDSSVTYDTTMSVANAYIDADTTVIPGMIAPPTTGVFTGDVVGNVTGKISYNWTMSPVSGSYHAVRVGANNERELYNVSPNGTISGTIHALHNIAGGTMYLIGIDAVWDTTLYEQLTSVDTEYTIPANTTALYIRNPNATHGVVSFNKFTLT